MNVRSDVYCATTAEDRSEVTSVHVKGRATWRRRSTQQATTPPLLRAPAPFVSARLSEWRLYSRVALYHYERRRARCLRWRGRARGRRSVVADLRLSPRRDATGSADASGREAQARAALVRQLQTVRKAQRHLRARSRTVTGASSSAALRSACALIVSNCSERRTASKIDQHNPTCFAQLRTHHCALRTHSRTSRSGPVGGLTCIERNARRH